MSLFKKSPPSPFYKRGEALPFVKGGQEGFYKINVVSNTLFAEFPAACRGEFHYEIFNNLPRTSLMD